jgi:hypothetical protein
MDRPVKADRRIALRFKPPARAQVTATVRPGCAVDLSNVSAAGALVRSFRPLRPGARVHLQVLCRERRFSISATVVRCSVATLHPLDGVSYANGLQFDHEVEWQW